jgi:hypothetical protein
MTMFPEIDERARNKPGPFQVRAFSVLAGVAGFELPAYSSAGAGFSLFAGN